MSQITKGTLTTGLHLVGFVTTSSLPSYSAYEVTYSEMQGILRKLTDIGEDTFSKG